MAIADLEGCHSKCHQCSYLFIKTSPWSNCSSNHQQKKERVMKSIFGYIAGVRTYWGLAAIVAVGYYYKRRTGNWEQSTIHRTEGSGGQSMLVFAKAVPQYLCWLRTKAISSVKVGAAWIRHTKHLQEANAIVSWESVCEVKAAESSTWNYVGWD